jgi:hypothetical protein
MFGLSDSPQARQWRHRRAHWYRYKAVARSRFCQLVAGPDNSRSRYSFIGIAVSHDKTSGIRCHQPHKWHRIYRVVFRSCASAKEARILRQLVRGRPPVFYKRNRRFAFREQCAIIY